MLPIFSICWGKLIYDIFCKQQGGMLPIFPGQLFCPLDSSWADAAVIFRGVQNLVIKTGRKVVLEKWAAFRPVVNKHQH